MTPVKGSCLCGSITFEFEAEPVLTGICHCRHCRKQSGGAFSINLAVPRAALKIEGRTLKTFRDLAESGQPVQRLFCGTCGSPIVSYSEGLPGVAFIKAGTLEDTSWLKPTMETWCETAQPWLIIDPSRTRAARNQAPERREADRANSKKAAPDERLPHRGRVGLLAAVASTKPPKTGSQGPRGPAQGALPWPARISPGNSAFKSILPEDIEWKTFPAFPPSARLAILVGQPSAPGPYVIRVKVPQGVKLMPHKHPEDRIYTVMSGVFYIGLGEKFDGSKVTAYPPGSVIVLPGDTWHFHWAKSGEYVTQVSAIGPLGLEYLDPADDPRRQAREQN